MSLVQVGPSEEYFEIDHGFGALSLEEYNCRPIQPGSIRLLTLQEAKNDTVQCTLDHCALEEAGEYHAVSYAWGNPLATCHIVCNERTLAVTPHLQEAFKCILFRYGPGIRVWVDAICINQDDDIEKGQQISQMHLIFGSAFEVIVWLGATADDSDLALSCIQDVYHQIKDMPLFLTGQDASDIFESQDQSKVLALLQLSKRPWFRRLWAVQEVSLASKAAILCGRSSCPLEQAASVLSKFGDFHVDHLGQAPRPGDHRSIRYQVYHFSLAREKGDPRESAQNLLDLVWAAMFLECREPIDRIFGLYGLLTDKDREAIGIDYNARNRTEYWRVYTRAARHMLQETHATHGTILLHSRDSGAAHPNLPSWCPDFHTINERAHFIFHLIAQHWRRDAQGEYIPYNAGRILRGTQQPTTVLFGDDECTITLRGMLVDRISSFLEVRWPPRPFTVITPSEASLTLVALEKMRLFVSYCQARDESHRAQLLAETTGGYESGLFPEFSCAEGLATTIRFLKNRASVQSPATELSDYDADMLRDLPIDVEAAFQNGYDLDVLFQEPENNAVEDCTGYLKILQRRLSDRSFFITRTGRIGYGSKDIRTGDAVVIFLGGYSAYCLRERQDYPGTWQYVHPAFLHGFMNGQVVEMLERGELEVQHFTLR